MPAVSVDLDKLFTARSPLPKPIERVAAARPFATATVTTDERILFIPTGEKILRKKGKHAGKEVDDRIRTVLVTATVQIDGRDIFRATNRGQSVFDSRDQTRKPLAFVRSELLRICGTDAAADQLAAIMPAPRPPKPRIVGQPLPVAETRQAGVPALQIRRVPFSARKHLLCDLWAVPFGV